MVRTANGDPLFLLVLSVCKNGGSCPRARTGGCLIAVLLRAGQLKLQFALFKLQQLFC